MITTLLALSLASSPVADDTDTVQRRQAALADLSLQLREETPPDAPASRTRVLDALDRYAAAGVFPHNHDSQTPVPLFLDTHGTPCAVAFMIMASGRDDLTRAIAADNNQVLLPHGDDGRVALWAAQNGFTVDELTRIQEPGYDLTEHEEPKPQLVKRSDRNNVQAPRAQAPKRIAKNVDLRSSLRAKAKPEMVARR